MSKEKKAGYGIAILGFIWLNLITNPWAGVAVLLMFIGLDILLNSPNK